MVEPMRNQTEGETVKVYQVLVYWLKNCGVTPTRHIMANDSSEEFKDTIKKNNTMFQMVPLCDNCRNIPKKGIQTFKEHVVSILCGVDINFSMQLWERLLQQAKLTLKFLRQSRLVPTISEYAQLYGPHDYNTEPLAPLLCNFEMHVKPAHRETFAPHLVSRFYIRTSQ